MENESIKSFDELNISTITTMTYSNFNIDTKTLFHLLTITPLPKEFDTEVSLKRKDIDRLKLKYNYGEIINVSTKSCFRGMILRRPKKKNCTVCNPTKNKKVKKSIIEIFQESENEIIINGKVIKVPITKIMYKCSGCEKIYNPVDVKKINHFLNQITIVMSLGMGKTPINIKIFHNGKFTITGCTEQDDAVEVMIILFNDLAPKLEKEYGIKITTLSKGEKEKRFVFDTVMRNYDFKLGFVLNRSVLNNIMSNPEYDSVIKLSKYIPTDDTNVKIKMIAPKSIDTPIFESLVLTGRDSEPKLEDLTSNPFAKPKKKVKEDLDTFIVFSSSATIFSGRNVKSMEHNYNIFIDIIKKYKNEIEEK